MKHLLFIFAFACSSAFAQTSTSEWHLQDSTGKDVGTYSTQSACDAAARAMTPINTTQVYGCPRMLRTKGKVVVVPPVVVPPVVVPPVTPPSLMPVVDRTKLPAPAVGFSGPRRQPAPPPWGNADAQGPNKSDVGAVRIGCQFSHMNFDDAIVYPGQAGVSHLHVYFGNTLADRNLASLNITQVGNSTCSGGTLNRSAYWAPAMIDTTDGSPVQPSALLVYYKTGYGGVKPADVKPVPTGLRFISGSSAGNPTTPSTAGRFACVGGNQGVGWQTTIPAKCFADNQMIMEVSFPQCWDGVSLDSPDHKSHMHEATGSGCPASHPVALPAIAYEIYYPMPADLTRMSKWRLSSDNYAATTAGGLSAHGDYLMGWSEDVMKTFITLCDNPSMDCHANLLGDGTWLY